MVAISEPSPPPLTDLKGKRAHSLSSIEGEGKAKKNRGLPFPTDLALSSSKALIMENEEEVRDIPWLVQVRQARL